MLRDVGTSRSAELIIRDVTARPTRRSGVRARASEDQRGFCIRHLSTTRSIRCSVGTNTAFDGASPGNPQDAEKDAAPHRVGPETLLRGGQGNGLATLGVITQVAHHEPGVLYQLFPCAIAVFPGTSRTSSRNADRAWCDGTQHRE
jgi:hypothetical protein